MSKMILVYNISGSEILIVFLLNYIIAYLVLHFYILFRCYPYLFTLFVILSTGLSSQSILRNSLVLICHQVSHKKNYHRVIQTSFMLKNKLLLWYTMVYHGLAEFSIGLLWYYWLWDIKKKSCQQKYVIFILMFILLPQANCITVMKIKRTQLKLNNKS